ncbi:MAG: hypothetical protein ACUVWN_14925 [bacterium]
MFERKIFPKSINRRKFVDDYQHVKRRKNIRFLPTIDLDLQMPKDIEKEIILDAIGNYILTCDGKELNKFLQEIEKTISMACNFIQKE